MTPLSVNQRRWSRFGLLFVAAVLVYAMLIFLGWIMGAVVVKRFPENYEWQVKSAIKNGDLDSAERIARNRVQSEYYDFGAHRLLATVMLKKGDPAKAVETLSMSLDRMNAAAGRNVFNRGADPAATYELLASILEQQGRASYANEISRLARDHRAISVIDDDPEKPDVPDHKTTGSKVKPQDAAQINLNEFHLAGGVTLTASDTIRFGSAGAATVSLKPLVSQYPSELLLNVSGEKALGLGGILKLSLRNREIFRVYADSVVPRWVSVPVEKDDAGASLPLTLEFINDAYDSVTKADRNVEVHQLRVR